MKIALAQFNPTIGDFLGNAARILDLAGQAKQRGANLALPRIFWSVRLFSTETWMN